MLVHRLLGFSLVETMIAMLLGVGSIAALASFIGHSIGYSSQLMLRSQLDDQVSSVFAMMTQDIRRIASLSSAVRLPPDGVQYQAFLSEWQLGHYPGEPANSCLLFAYDINANGKLDIRQPNERLGFRLRDNSIEIRQDGAQCDQNGWQDASDPTLATFQQLHFHLEGEPAKFVVITVKAYAKGRRTLTRHISSKQWLMNHGE